MGRHTELGSAPRRRRARLGALAPVGRDGPRADLAGASMGALVGAAEVGGPGRAGWEVPDTAKFPRGSSAASSGGCEAARCLGLGEWGRIEIRSLRGRSRLRQPRTGDGLAGRWAPLPAWRSCTILGLFAPQHLTARCRAGCQPGSTLARARGPTWSWRVKPQCQSPGGVGCRNQTEDCGRRLAGAVPTRCDRGPPDDQDPAEAPQGAGARRHADRYPPHPRRPPIPPEVADRHRTCGVFHPWPLRGRNRHRRRSAAAEAARRNRGGDGPARLAP